MSTDQLDADLKAAHPYVRQHVSSEKYWLLLFIVGCASVIVGCACYSLRVTKRRMRKSLQQDKRYRAGAFEGEAHRADVSCDVSDVSSGAESSQGV